MTDQERRDALDAELQRQRRAPERVRDANRRPNVVDDTRDTVQEVRHEED